MKKSYTVSIAIILVLLGCLAVYRYVYLSSNSCVQVLVSATNRITGEEKVFGDPCSVPFWYKGVLIYNPEQSPGEETTTLDAPVAILAYDNVVDLLLLGRECNRTYIIERSYNERDWGTVGTTTFYEYPPEAGTTCPKDFIDSSVVSGTKKLWYRYGLLDEKGSVTIWSNMGEVTLEEEY